MMDDKTTTPQTPAEPATENPGAERAPGGESWAAQLQRMIDDISRQAAPVVREVAAKAAELAAGAAGRGSRMERGRRRPPPPRRRPPRPRRRRRRTAPERTHSGRPERRTTGPRGPVVSCLAPSAPGGGQSWCCLLGRASFWAPPSGTRPFDPRRPITRHLPGDDRVEQVAVALHVLRVVRRLLRSLRAHRSSPSVLILPAAPSAPTGA